MKKVLKKCGKQPETRRKPPKNNLKKIDIVAALATFWAIWWRQLCTIASDSVPDLVSDSVARWWPDLVVIWSGRFFAIYKYRHLVARWHCIRWRHPVARWWCYCGPVVATMAQMKNTDI